MRMLSKKESNIDGDNYVENCKRNFTYLILANRPLIKGQEVLESKKNDLYFKFHYSGFIDLYF